MSTAPDAGTVSVDVLGQWSNKFPLIPAKAGIQGEKF
jgi:hypothetical protein